MNERERRRRNGLVVVEPERPAKRAGEVRLPGAEFAVGGPLDLQKDDVLLFMTDGLFECMNQSDETFGIERVKDTLERSASGSAQAILDGLLAAADAWANGVTQRDDITVVVVKVL